MKQICTKINDNNESNLNMVKFKVNFPHRKVEDARKMILNYIGEVGVDSCAIAFNGGKDSIVLQHLVRTTIGLDTNIKILLWHVKGEFGEVMDCVNNFLNEPNNVDVIRFSDSTDMMSDVKTLVEQGSENIFLGTRVADIRGGEKPEFTKPMWGGGTRIMPLMFFTIADIGDYLNHYQIPYPSYYKRGYTSLGTVRSTIPNPFLYDFEQKEYLAAWFLPHASLERANRAYVNKALKSETAAITCSQKLDPAILELAISEIEKKEFDSIKVFNLDRSLKSLREEFKYVWVLGGNELASL